RGVGCDLASDLQQPSHGLVDVAHRADEHYEERRYDQRRDQADRERGAPESVGRRCERHLPTATFRSARAECRIRTPESLMRAIPPSASVCARTTSTPCTAPRAWPAIRCARRTIVMTITAATAITTTP